MTKSRHDFDPLKTSDEDRWLAVSDDFRYYETEKLPPGTDLRATYVKTLARYAADGWKLEEFSSQFSSCFVNRGRERRMIHIRPTDPDNPLPAGHGTWR